jgi:hypothetical protein
MLPDELKIEIETIEEVDIKVEGVSDVELIVDDSFPDISVQVPTDEVKVTIENREIDLLVNKALPNIDLIIESNPDVIVLPTAGLTGPEGPEGPPGPIGPSGPPGLPGDQTTYTFTQSMAVTLWDIAHNLGRYPSVTVIDTGGTEIIPDIHYVDSNRLKLNFAYATSGKAYLN